jgi:hypothetical protein
MAAIFPIKAGFNQVFAYKNSKITVDLFNIASYFGPDLYNLVINVDGDYPEKIQIIGATLHRSFAVDFGRSVTSKLWFIDVFNLDHLVLIFGQDEVIETNAILYPIETDTDILKKKAVEKDPINQEDLIPK